MELEAQTGVTGPDFEPESKIFVRPTKKIKISYCEIVNGNSEFLVKKTCRKLRAKQHEDSHIGFEILPLMIRKLILNNHSFIGELIWNNTGKQ